jgi:hypothetical protein
MDSGLRRNDQSSVRLAGRGRPFIGAGVSAQSTLYRYRRRHPGEGQDPFSTRLHSVTFE